MYWAKTIYEYAAGNKVVIKKLKELERIDELLESEKKGDGNSTLQGEVSISCILFHNKC